MDHVIGLKESIGSMKRVAELARSMTKPVLCGEDELFLLHCAAELNIWPIAAAYSIPFF